MRIEKLRASVDSGAAVSILPARRFPNHALAEKPSGVTYTSASNHPVPDKGAKRLYGSPRAWTA